MRKARGITMLEILIALSVSAFALAAAVLAANAQERSYYQGHRQRAAQNAAREALLVLERKLPMAGYGMDAPLAFDFQWYDAAAAGTCPAELDPCVPDKVGDSDEVTFYARNPAYWVTHTYGEAIDTEPKGRAWNLVALSGDTLTLKVHAGDQFPKGQILQLLCAGELEYAYVTVLQTTPYPDPAPLEGAELEITLEPTVTADPFRRQDIGATLTCLGKPTARVFQIDRYRFHVRPVALGGGRYQPYLMLDQGIDTEPDQDVDEDDEIYLAEGIESLQIAYVFGEPSIPVAGNVGGTPIAIADPAATAPGATAQTIVPTRFPPPTVAGKSDFASSSFYAFSTVTLPPERKTNAQGNIRRVLVSVVARSAEPDPTSLANLSYATGSTLYRLNQNAAPTWITDAAAARGTDGYQRTVAETGIALPNMLVRSLSYF